MKPHRLVAALVALGTLGAAFAQEVEPGQKPPSSASAPSFSNTWKSIKDKLRGGSKPDNAPEGAAPSTDSAAPASNAQAGDATAIKLKDFTPGSKLPANWNDTHCKNLVEPFGMTDAAMSLAKFKAESEGRTFIDKLTGTSSARPNTRSEIRDAARRLNWLPMPLEIQIGQQMHEGQNDLLRDAKGGKEPYARARAILADVVTQVKEPNPYQFQIFVTKLSGGNAESAPGGFIYVDKDVVEKASDEPRARFVIAHEVSHVLQRHRTRETQMRLSDGVDSLEDLGKLMTSVQGGSTDILKKGLDLKRLYVRHSEEQELQADGCAVRLVGAMSRDRTETITSINAFIQTLPKPTPPVRAEKQTAETAIVELSDGQFSRHPSTEQRTKNLNLVLADLRAGR